MRRNAVLVLIVLLAVVLVACNDAAPEAVPTPSTPSVATPAPTPTPAPAPAPAPQETKAAIEMLVDEFRSAGMNVGDYRLIAHEMIGAAAGRKFELDGSVIEVYEYDPYNLTEEAKKIFKDATDYGIFSWLGFQVPCVMNGNFMLIVHDHPKKDDVIKVFKEFQP